MTTQNLKPWNGTTPGGWQMPYDYSHLMIDENGTVWYQSENEWHIWCSASRLDKHVHHLEQIYAR